MNLPLISDVWLEFQFQPVGMKEEGPRPLHSLLAGCAAGRLFLERNRIG